MRQKGHDRAAVVEAAGALADAHGLRELTLAMLASELGMRSQSLYAHVEGIDGLRRALALLGQRRLAEELRDAVMAQTGVHALRSLCHTYARFAIEHPGLYEATLRAPGEDDEVMVANQRVAEPFFAVLASLGIEGEDAIHRYRIIWTSLFGFTTAWRDGLMSWPVTAEQSLELLIGTFASHATRGDSPR